MKVAIIGCGYVGMAVARCWQEAGDVEITATTTTADRLLALEAIAQKVAIARGNDAETLRSLLKGCDTVLLTLGARGAAYEDTYLATAATLVSLLPDLPALRQIIYTSSCAVYGDRAAAWVHETSSPAPANENSSILARTEETLLAARNQSLAVCILRLGGIYGPGRELVRIYGRVAGQTRAGTGEEASNWIHLEDIVGAIDFALRQQLDGIYNLVDDSHLTTGELIAAVLAAHNLPPVIWDTSQPSQRSYNAKVANQKIKDAGYIFQRPQIQVDSQR